MSTTLVADGIAIHEVEVPNLSLALSQPSLDVLLTIIREAGYQAEADVDHRGRVTLKIIKPAS